MKKIKQITFLSAIIISIGSTIGAGIFFKNAEIFRNAGGSLAFAISAWAIAGFGILAIGIALIEVSSKTKNEGGILEWTKKFTPRWFGNFSSSYMLLIYLPINYFAMPIYATLSLQDVIQSINPDVTFSGWTVAAIAFAFFLWFVFMGHFKLRASEKVQWIFTGLKFLPLAVVPILSLIDVANNGLVTDVPDTTTVGLTAFSPWLGLMASIPAILFAVDGFYVTTSLKNDLKDSRKIGQILVVSITAIVIAYIIFALSLGLAGYGDFLSISFVKQNTWLKATINVIIVCAVLGILNGFGMVTPKVYRDTESEESVLHTVALTQRLFKIKTERNAAFLASFLLATTFYVLLVPIGIYAWNGTTYASYGETAGNIYEMADLVTNFTSMFIFLFIGMSIWGCVRNRKTNRIEVVKYRFFIPAAFVSVIFIAIGTVYMFISSILNMTGINDADTTTSITRFSVLTFTTLLAIIPQVIGKYFGKSMHESKRLYAKKRGSI